MRYTTKTPNILLEDGYGLQYEDGNYVVGSDDDLMNFVNDPLIVLEEAGVPTLGVSNQTTDFLASEVTNPKGVFFWVRHLSIMTLHLRTDMLI